MVVDWDTGIYLSWGNDEVLVCLRLLTLLLCLVICQIFSTASELWLYWAGMPVLSCSSCSSISSISWCLSGISKVRSTREAMVIRSWLIYPQMATIFSSFAIFFLRCLLSVFLARASISWLQCISFNTCIYLLYSLMSSHMVTNSPFLICFISSLSLPICHLNFFFMLDTLSTSASNLHSSSFHDFSCDSSDLILCSLRVWAY